MFFSVECLVEFILIGGKGVYHARSRVSSIVSPGGVIILASGSGSRGGAIRVVMLLWNLGCRECDLRSRSCRFSLGGERVDRRCCDLAERERRRS